MKKLITTIITTILLFSCLGLTAFANPASVTISDDYQKITLDGNTYSRFNASAMDVEYFDSDILVELNATQQETIDDVSLQTDADATFIYANIHFKDGAVLSVEFLRDDYLETYHEISASENGTYIIDFEYPEGNTVAVEKSDLFGNSVVLTEDELGWCDYYPVITQSNDGILTADKGSLIIIEDKYYYVNYEEIDAENWHDFNPYEYVNLPAYEISDTALIAKIQEAEDAYYSDDFGFLLDDSLTKGVSAVFLIFVFAIIPFAIFVVFLILAFRSKTVYKKMFRLIYILSAAELAVFTLITVLVLTGRS
ncbi:MAG: hypothetical protein IJE23_00885 [Tyzzerella sp.]|nr:hypothetical protein [Tyzzerella sp.]